MKRLTNILFSFATTLTLLVIFATAIGAATIIEEKYDTVTAKLLVYQAGWFELLLLMLVVNLTGNIIRLRLYRIEKWPALLFHLALIVIITGAAITRYIGNEGYMHIREGSASSSVFTSDSYIQVRVIGQGVDQYKDQAVLMSPFFKSDFHVKIPVRDETISVRFSDYIPNAVEEAMPDSSGGVSLLEIMVSGQGSPGEMLIAEGESQRYGGTVISFNNRDSTAGIILTGVGGQFSIRAISGIEQMVMHGADAATDSVNRGSASDTIQELQPGIVYKTPDLVLILKKVHLKARKDLVPAPSGVQGSEVLKLLVAAGDKQREVSLMLNTNGATVNRKTVMEGYTIMTGYGSKEITLPFSLTLDDFILDRYAGSMSPSSYASEVTLRDAAKKTEEKHRIYMNHVLDYDGYRFFQSSYDPDEKGTILSVNHDSPGTLVTYIGYIMLGAGFLMIFFNRRSRFSGLRREMAGIRQMRKKALTVFTLILLMAFNQVLAKEPAGNAVDRIHADQFGHLLVQTYDGRFEPMHTLALDAIHKISRKSMIMTNPKGELTAIQVFIDMMLDPEYWKDQKIIYVREKSVRDLIGIKGSHAAFTDFLDAEGNYKLSAQAETAFRKGPPEQNAFDKEIIRLDERLNIWIMVQNGSLLKVFPVEGVANNRWISFTDSLAMAPLTGKSLLANKDLSLTPLNLNTLMRYYFTALLEGARTGDYSKAVDMYNRIRTIQRGGASAELLPSDQKIELEISYNNSEIFIILRNIYGILGVLLILLAFTDNFASHRNRWVNWLFAGLAGVTGAAFLWHTYGLLIRWYLTVHAPWSNGYEALLLIGWGSILAGFLFLRQSKITFAATALLAFAVLMTAGHSSYDPQLTNLQPVLKSYWLIIHVAVITISYGFLALGFFLGLINLFLFVTRTQRSGAQFDLLIRELTLTNEMALAIGLVMATLGTFLGGVWANESWGRYWGWDAKETWALVIVITYAIILHLRFVPKMRGPWVFNTAAVVGFSSVIMTFFGVNYYLTKGLHSYAADDKRVFPGWAWVMIISIVALIIVSGLRYRHDKK